MERLADRWKHLESVEAQRSEKKSAKIGRMARTRVETLGNLRKPVEWRVESRKRKEALGYA